ncbi:transcriptional regulator family: Fungal Specific TF [Aspergillus niger]|uniref:Zn(II)2Cys6 transcription factor domain-containing protein n=1 Tax=Aspergillus lacticoffeatus (strain CBS 101883) TaxID=1450533 RepID=UPI0001F26175|nr:uncharacterized protein BO96DRAFT_457667 [Aspergillus niger CBS 101883]KAI2819929.1 transcriptional regulator family: Fungal Specific TF [Aspergillus niger]KAI2843050.1 transcriptional regulator family: Fungal Specific TF [Aspergillus niger]KAI2849496.1 transcriptional regulator family: Fungal Specific TF [Aspergillus niger]KAI2873127.1 transcriptional regulator family: Fungal Specific TF [Aspergillus niger]KAI2904264.1 transcriptional regulator family: Fungal Specific TF [Aspergillus niger|eukprot:XP_001396910.2 hypothetical protein ANI_1_1384134 [Aspergillus niger CBS 513.88]
MPTPSLTHRPKSRPTASCLPCRTRKVKCNRLQPCETCSARNIAHECKYAVPDEDRQAIAQAEIIAELRAEVNRLRQQMNEYEQEHEDYMEGGGRGEVDVDGLFLEGDDDDGLGEGVGEGDELERVYQILKDGSWERVREVVGRIRRGEDVTGITV